MLRASALHIVRAVVVSLGLHGAAFVWVKVRPAAAEPAHVAPADVWSGAGVELGDAPIEADGTTPSVTHDVASDSNVIADVDLDTAPPAPASPEPENDAERRTAKQRMTTTNQRATSERRARNATSPSTLAPSSTPSAPSTPSSSAPGAAFGSAGLPRGVRYLPKAYTRALSQGGWGVSGFRTVSPGKLCEASLSIAVTDDHGVGPVDYGSENEREALEPLCRTLFENARRLIASGEFSLDPTSLASGVMRLRVTVTVSDGEPREGSPDDAPHGLWSESHEPVAPGRRGRSSFTLNSGRRVDALVELG